MSARSARSSGSLPSKPPALISMPTSSPTPLTFAVTAPPATVPSTRVSASRCWASWSCSCICCACWSSAFMSKPPPPSASNGFWVIGPPSRLAGCSSRVLDLLDHLRTELALEQLGGTDALILRVDVVGVRLGVGRRPVRAALRRRRVATAGLLDGLTRRLGGLGPRRLGGRLGLGGRRLRRGLGYGYGGAGDRRRALGLGARVDDRLDLPVGPDHVDRGLADHVVAATVHEGLAGAGVREAEGQDLAVDRDDLAVLGEVHPGHPAARLGRVHDVGPEPAYVDEGERAAGGGRGGDGLRLGLRLGGRLRLGRWRRRCGLGDRL